MHEDLELRRRLLAGEEDAFDEFFDAYFPALYRFALPRLNRDAAAAEEVAQATVCRALSRLATYRGEAALFTWLCTFCRHEVAAYCQKNRIAGHRVKLVEEDAEVRAALESAAAASAHAEPPDRAFDRAELARRVQVALDHLPPRYRRALSWKYLEELPVNEIASRLQVSPKAAESVLSRARESFREVFAALAEPRAKEST